MCSKCYDLDSNNEKRPSMDAEPMQEIVVEKNEVASQQIEGRSLISPQSSSAALYAVFLSGLPAINTRSQPNPLATLTGTIPTGSIISAHQQTNADRAQTTWNGGFGWVRLLDNRFVAGWQGTGFTNTGGNQLWAAHARSFQGVVPSAVNLRVGPGTEFNTAQIGPGPQLQPNTRVNITHLVARNSLPWSHTIPSRIDSQIWLRISSIITPAGQVIQGNAWVRADLVGNLPPQLVTTSGPMMGAISPIPEVAVVTSSFLNRRLGPGIHTLPQGQYPMGQVLNITRSQRNITEDRLWSQTTNNTWVARENVTLIEHVHDRVFLVNVQGANFRSAPVVANETLVSTLNSNTRLRITHRLRVTGGMDWFRFNQIIGGTNQVGWIADINGFVEGEVGSPGVQMAPNFDFTQPWIDSRAVSLRNPDYIPGHTTGPHRPFFSTRNVSDITQIVIHHTASSTSLTRMDIEAGWRGMGWWNGGYHEMIHANGRSELCYNPNVITNGAYGQNAISYHISLVGNFRENGNQPTTVQMTTLLERVRLLQRRFNLPTFQVVGHSERTPTICPGLNMERVRGMLGGATLFTPPASPADRARIQEIVEGAGTLIFGILGFGKPPGLVNFAPNLTNTLVEKTFTIPPFLKGKVSFQEVFETSSPLEISIENGRVTNVGVASEGWNIASASFREIPTVNLPSLEIFSHRLGNFVQDGSASLSVEAAFPAPKLVLEIIAEHKLPSGNKFKFKMKLELELILHWRERNDLDLGYALIESKVTEEQMDTLENDIWNQVLARIAYFTNNGLMSPFISLAIIAAVVALLLSIPAKLALVPLLGITYLIGIMQDEIDEIFRSRGFEA